MGKRDRYEPGTFCWVDLSTSDASGAEAFYGPLFGWDFEETGAPDGTYVMCRVEGDVVAAIVQQDQRPGHWNSYVTVASADETATRARQLGARIIEEPFDVMDAGRMAVLADPQGAVLCIWEPREHIGARRVNDPGCLTWNDLQTRDVLGAADFYRRLFGWETQVVGDGEAPDYVVLLNAGRSNGGIVPMASGQGDPPPHWLPYFTVSSTDAAAETAKTLGGTVLAGPIDMGAGRIAILVDPQGARFAVFEGETDD